jgi:hypothetical protein
MFTSAEAECIYAAAKNMTQYDLTILWLEVLGIKYEVITKFNGYTGIELLDAEESCHGDFSTSMYFDENGKYVKIEIEEN